MVSVFIPQNLHNGIADVLSILHLMEFAVNACSWAASIIHSVSFLRKSFFIYFHDSPVPIFSAFLLNSPCKAFLFLFLFVTSSFIVVFKILLSMKYFLIASSFQYPPLLSGIYKCNAFFSLFIHYSFPIKSLSPSLLVRYNLATLFLVYIHPFIAMIFLVFLSILRSSSFV